MSVKNPTASEALSDAARQVHHVKDELTNLSVIIGTASAEADLDDSVGQREIESLIYQLTVLQAKIEQQAKSADSKED